MHGTRSVIALAEKLGAAYDHVRGRELLNEIALFTQYGGMFTTPGEVRRRADLIVVIGDIPASHHDMILSWASAPADLTGKQSRSWFHLKANRPSGDTGMNKHALKVGAVSLSAEGASLGAAVALLRAGLAGKRTAIPLANLDSLKTALADAEFPVFVFSGNPEEPTSLAMLQGLVSDLNRSKRASSLFLPSDDAAWGAVLTSVWMTGFPPRTGFPNGAPVYDPQRWDIQRMLREKEADLHLWISASDGASLSKRGKIPLVALARTRNPVRSAAVTICVAAPGIDHDSVIYSSRIGTFRAERASAPSDMPEIAGVIRQLSEALPC
ncbi:tungsten formylmethanofuran dehydrogenase [Phyllobacterium phragmitis]|uniref:tungsten formylmethanofuran dehydrogenase n=1 Tax=Phyllobacterium phragmitis TaxID=2670329 RepID=UPI0011B1E217|nr:tungsten formylmethanofuran dehydrogenase [Phyllobacterium phragmitis]